MSEESQLTFEDLVGEETKTWTEETTDGEYKRISQLAELLQQNEKIVQQLELELEEAKNLNDRKSEIGDVLFAIVNVCRYLDADPEIQKSEEKIQYYKTIVDSLIEIIDNLKWRHQTISNIIRWKQFQSGN